MSCISTHVVRKLDSAVKFIIHDLPSHAAGLNTISVSTKRPLLDKYDFRTKGHICQTHAGLLSEICFTNSMSSGNQRVISFTANGRRVSETLCQTQLRCKMSRISILIFRIYTRTRPIVGVRDLKFK